MIAALTGKLIRADEGFALVECGPLTYELLVPAVDRPDLAASVGESVTFHTIFYLGGDPTRGGLEPTLIGFLRPDDKRFFELFTTVKGIGPKKALKALAVSVGEIASAIEGKDTRFLVGLPEIGKRTAEQIVAELAGKAKSFAAAHLVEAKGTKPSARHDSAAEDAVSALVSLGERRSDAEGLLERVRLAHPEMKATDALLREMLQLRRQK
jgi:Holliday junction DNA helicase RuvA